MKRNEAKGSQTRRDLKAAGTCCMMPQFIPAHTMTYNCGSAECSITPGNVGVNTRNTWHHGDDRGENRPGRF